MAEPRWPAIFAKTRYDAVLTRRYPPQDTIRRKQFEVEDALQSYLGAQAVVPNNAANGPVRFVMQGRNSQLQATDFAMTLSMSFDAPPSSGFRRALTRAASEMDKLDSILRDQKVCFRVFSLSRYYIGSVEEIKDALQEIAGRTLKEAVTDPSALTFTITERSGVLESTIDLGRYASATVQAQPATKVAFDFDFISKDEEGIVLKVDVSSRPSLDKPSSTSFADMSDALFHLSTSKLTSILDVSFPVA